MKKIGVILILLIFLVGCEYFTAEPAEDPSSLTDAELQHVIDDTNNEKKGIVGNAFGYKFSRSYKIDSYTLFRYQALEELYERRNYGFIMEICNNDLDDNSDGLIDCNDVSKCYAPNTAPNNVCSGESSKVLLNGYFLGNIHSDLRKSIQGEVYQDGSDACKRTLSKNCELIEVYGKGTWKKTELVGCSSSLESFPDLTTTNYRAVCGGPKVGSIGRTSIKTVEGFGR